jgi:hypothetical protein
MRIARLASRLVVLAMADKVTSPYFLLEARMLSPVVLCA